MRRNWKLMRNIVANKPLNSATHALSASAAAIMNCYTGPMTLPAGTTSARASPSSISNSPDGVPSFFNVKGRF